MRSSYLFPKLAFYLGATTILFELLKTLAILISGDPRNSPQIYWLLFLRSGNPVIEFTIVFIINIAILMCCFSRIQGGRMEYRRVYWGLILGIFGLILAAHNLFSHIFYQYEHLSSLSTLDKNYHLNAYLSTKGESEYLVNECPQWGLLCQTYRVAYISDKTEVKNAKLTRNSQTNSFAIQTVNGAMTLTNSDGSWPQLADTSKSK